MHLLRKITYDGEFSEFVQEKKGLYNVGKSTLKTYHISKSFFKCPSRQIHWSYSKQWQCVNSDHDDNEKCVKDNFEKSNDKFCIEHEHCFIFPWVFTEKSQ